ncbi:DUF2796 domain-containing protein [Brucella sp. BE17]|uniref:DUF2796 domain-containing protein n=1 Tax=Brucella sp. BE17 TaxID=3142977 RepID=UPI0031BA8743
MFMLASAAHAEEERRELGPHVHGHGSLMVAIEGNNIQMEFVAPGMDIVGFEHEADTNRQKRAVEAALADLKEPLNLFELPESAGCAVTSTDVKLVAEEHEHDHGAAQTESPGEIDDEENHHSEFRATYALTCEAAEQIKSINFRFFDRFRDASELSVTFIDADGEAAFGVSRNFRNMER